MSKNPPRYLGVSEAARILEIAPATLRRLANEGRITCIRSSYEHRLFDPAVIEAEKKRRDAKRLKRVG